MIKRKFIILAACLGLSVSAYSEPSLASPAFSQEIAPFGANLFEGRFSGSTHNMLAPDYRIHVGDPLNIRLWGAVNEELRQEVDNQGNIFIPRAGPLRVAGMEARDLGRVLSEHIRSVYNDSVNVYATLDMGLPIAVTVTGQVTKPGRYTGVAAEGPLYFLDRAGGPDAARGSYRRVDIMRNNERIAQLDLYDFLRSGRVEPVALRNGDVVFVHPRGASIEVVGEVARPASFELTGASTSGADLISIAAVGARATHVLHRGMRDGSPMESYLDFDTFSRAILRDGDHVEFVSDGQRQVATIRVEGAHQGVGTLSVPRGTPLSHVLHNIPVDPVTADLSSVHIKRRSVASRQRQALEESLDRLARVMASSEAISAQDAQIRRTEAELVNAFMERARTIEPEGRVSLAGSNLDNFLLEDGDIVVVPQRTGTISVSGEVMMPQAVVFREGMRAEDYVARAGGFSGRGAASNIMIRALDGSVVPADARPLRPGDEVIALPKTSSNLSVIAAAALETLYRLAVTAAIVAAF